MLPVAARFPALPLCPQSSHTLTLPDLQLCFDLQAFSMSVFFPSVRPSQLHSSLPSSGRMHDCALGLRTLWQATSPPGNSTHSQPPALRRPSAPALCFWVLCPPLLANLAWPCSKQSCICSIVSLCLPVSKLSNCFLQLLPDTSTVCDKRMFIVAS